MHRKPRAPITATAQSLLGSADIKNNSLKSADVKNGNLRGKDLRRGAVALNRIAPAARDALQGDRGSAGETGAKGDTGAPGAPGVAGAPGAPGASGLSRVLDRSNPAAFDPPNDPGTSVLPAGPTPVLAANSTHVITFQAQVNPTAANWQMACDLTAGGDLIDRVISAGSAASDRTQIVGHAVFTTTTIELLDLTCADDGTGTILDDLTVSALAVDEAA